MTKDKSLGGFFMPCLLFFYFVLFCFVLLYLMETHSHSDLFQPLLFLHSGSEAPAEAGALASEGTLKTPALRRSIIAP
ncbi:MAG: hypothetical protein PHV18_07965 [Lachnospiraceae bacterium]|nr:hypothetical protein [Lachnospiraceae bacterium]